MCRVAKSLRGVVGILHIAMCLGKGVAKSLRGAGRNLAHCK